MLHWLYEQTWGVRQAVQISNFSNLTVFLIVGSIGGLYRHHNCAEPWCPRLARHPVAGTGHRTCHSHATVAVHDRLFAEHAAKHPEQHELLNRKAP